MNKTPNAIDRHVGTRIRIRRTTLGLTQEKLGEALGITFQQVQKYEKGTNRVGAVRLMSIAQVLNVPILFFFDGAPGVIQTQEEDSSTSSISSVMNSKDCIAVATAFDRIKDKNVRASVMKLVKALSETASSHQEETAVFHADH